MDSIAPLNTVSAAIQLAIAPVFLLVLALLCLLLETSISTRKMLQGAADLIGD